MDKTKSGKVRPWREKKIANVDYFELLHILEFKKAERVKDCAEILEYKQNRETGERKLYRVWFCKSRLELALPPIFLMFQKRNNSALDHVPSYAFLNNGGHPSKLT